MQPHAHPIVTTLIALALASAGCASLPPKNFAAFLPPALDASWQRSAPVTGPADAAQFGGGLSTSADYRDTASGCSLRITITGDAPMMQGLSMNSSNPAAAGLTGARVAYVGDEPVVITASGEVQALTRNYLTQYAGDCPLEARLGYVAITPFDGLRDFDLPASRDRRVSPQAVTAGFEWAASFGGADKDWAYAMTGTADGGLCTAGRTESKGAGLEDVWLVRLDGNGRLLWDRTYGGPAIDRGRAIVETPDRGLVVAGATESKGAGEYDVWVLKVDARGELLWDRHFGGAATDWASGVTVTRDGGVAVAAYTQDEPGGPYDFWVIRLDSAGELLWERRYGGRATDWSNAIAATSDGGFVVVGHTESKGAGGADFWVLKLDAGGEPQWDQTFGGPATDYASTVAVMRNGHILVAGMTQIEGAGFDSRVLKLDTNGAVVWDRTLGGAGDDWVRAIVETRDGSLALGGYTTSSGAGLNDVWLVQLTASGTVLRERTWGEAANEWARALVELPDGGLALAGDTYSRGAGSGDVLVLKLAHDPVP